MYRKIYSFSHQYAKPVYDRLSKYLPYQSIAIYTDSNGVDHVAYSPSVMKMNSPVIESDMLESRVSLRISPLITSTHAHQRELRDDEKRVHRQEQDNK